MRKWPPLTAQCASKALSRATALFGDDRVRVLGLVRVVVRVARAVLGADLARVRAVAGLAPVEALTQWESVIRWACNSMSSHK